MPKCNPNLAGPKHVHNSPTRTKYGDTDSVRPGDRQVVVERNGEVIQTTPQGIRAGDILCDREGRKLRDRKHRATH